MKLNKYLGKTLYGYCDGYFGRDSYKNKTIVYTGDNYLLCEDEDGHPCLAIFYTKSNNEIKELLKEWTIDSEEQDE